jgi:hypothetical protein
VRLGPIGTARKGHADVGLWTASPSTLRNALALYPKGIEEIRRRVRGGRWRVGLLKKRGKDGAGKGLK